MKNDVGKRRGRLNSGDPVRPIRDALDGRDWSVDIAEMSHEQEFDMPNARASKGNVAGVHVKMDRNRAKGFQMMNLQIKIVIWKWMQMNRN